MCLLSSPTAKWAEFPTPLEGGVVTVYTPEQYSYKMKNEYTGICFLKYLKIWRKKGRKAEKVKNLTVSLGEVKMQKCDFFFHF